jgi:NAD(P)H-hydrate repair Nnr-like enzyme with NAD(P)H-hydrate epimerase domain
VALHADAVIDTLIGYSLRGAPDDAYQPLIGLTALPSFPPGALVRLD